MKVTFLILKDFRQYHSLSSGPIGLAYLAGAAKARFPDIEINIEVDPARVIAHRPDIIGISAFTETYSQSIEAAIQMRQALPEIPIWVGGPHLNALPMTLAPCFDVGVFGEGEHTFVELLEHYQQGRLKPSDLADIHGIVYWDQGQRKMTPSRETIMELDQIIRPERTIMTTWWPPKQQQILWPQPIYTSRGCPFKCVFCIYSTIQQKVRYHSVERVISEIEEIVRLRPQQDKITIHDDLFTLSKKRLAELSNGIRSAGLHRRVAFICMAKASVFDQEMAMLLRDMNVSIITFGFESGVPRLLRYLKGERAKVEENVRAIDICAEYGIRVGGYFIIGTPRETYQELQQSYWFIRQHYPPMSMAGIFRLTPFPGTQFWQEAIERGLVSNTMEDWRPFNYADYEKKDFLFQNDHYSLADFNSAYAWFFKIMERNVIGPALEEQELLFKKWQEPVYQNVWQQLPANSSILEVTGFSRLTLRDIAAEHPRPLTWTQVKPWELKEFVPNTHYDLIICNFAYEQTTSTLDSFLRQLESSLNPGGRLLFFWYNPRHIALLTRLLADQWDLNYLGFRPFDLMRFATWPQLRQQLSLVGLSVSECHPLASAPLNEAQQGLVTLLRQLAPQGDLEDVSIFGYTVITTAKEGTHHHGANISTPVQCRQG